MTKRCLLGELDVVELPAGSDISHVRQVDVNGSASFDVHLAEIKLVHGVVVL